MSIYQDHKPAGGGSAYLKLKDGDAIRVRFYSPPAVVTYDGEKLRYQVILYNKTANLAQIFEFGPQIFGQLADLYEEWDEPGNFDMTIKRTGSGQFDTEYSVIPSPNSVELSKDQVTELVTMEETFPGKKSKWLSDYEKDHVMPEVIEITLKSGYDSAREVVAKLGTTIDEEPMPEMFEEFLK